MSEGTSEGTFTEALAMRRDHEHGENHGNARAIHSRSSLASEHGVVPIPPPPKDPGIRFFRQECPGREFWQDQHQRQAAAAGRVSGVHCCLEARRAKIQGRVLGG